MTKYEVTASDGMQFRANHAGRVDSPSTHTPAHEVQIVMRGRHDGFRYSTGNGEL